MIGRDDDEDQVIAEDDNNTDEREMATVAMDHTPRKLVFTDEVAHATPTAMGQYKTLFAKRFHYAKRDTRTIVMQIVLPVVCITFAMLLTLIEFTNQPPVAFDDHGAYGGPINIPYANCPTNWGASLPNTPVMVNATRAEQLSTYLIDTQKSHGADHRLSAHVCADATLRPVNPATGSPLAPASTASVVFSNNSRYPHAGPLALLDFQGTWTRFYGSPNVRVSFTNHPLPLSDYEKAFVDAIVTVFVAIFVLIPFTFIPSTFVSFIVKERETHALQLQQASGLRYVVYWCSNFSCGFMLVLLAYILNIIESTKSTGEVLRYFFRIVPSYCLGEGILNLANRQLLESFGQKKSAFDMEVTGWPMLYMGLEIPIFMLVVFYLDSPLRREQAHKLGEADIEDEPVENPIAAHEEDEDVAAERREIESGSR